MSDERQEVILLAATDIGNSDISSTVASSCTPAANSAVLTKLITASNTSGTSASNTFILYIPAFRKIEPKPGVELKNSKEEEEKEVIDKDAKSSAGRFLAINATKRGVKTCPVCLKKIGYRAKQCKHCSPSKIRHPRRARPSISIKPIESKTVELLAQHVVCSSSDTTQEDVQERTSGSLIPSGVAKLVANQAIQERIVTNLEEQQLETMVPSLDQETSQEFEGSLLEPQVDQQGVEAPKEQEEHSLLTNASQVNEPLEDHQQLGNTVGEILNCPEKIVIDDSEIVSNVTEVTTTSSECVEKLAEGTSQAESQESINTVFISSKMSENSDSQTLANSSGRYSLQELICGLLAQNQGVNLNQSESKVCEENTSVVGLQTDSVESTEDTQGRSTEPIKEKMAENSYDANSVALFLGEMAQRNNGKKRKVPVSKPLDAEPKVVALLPGTNSKCILVTGSEHKPAKFRKIQPKDSSIQEEHINACEDEKEASKDFSNETKGDCQYRIMNGNATRRGVMLCSKCNKMIGCRSKICKHCKHRLDESPARQASNKIIKQAVKLCLPANLGVQIFSVRKCKTGPELRCFVQFDCKESSDTSTADKSSKYSCDYPLCITAKELGDKMSSFMCEHAKVCCTTVNILKAKIPTLDLQKLTSMEFGSDMKGPIQKLYSQCLSKNVPLVQYVSCRTLAVVEHINTDSNDPLGTEIISFAHVRFENVKGQGCFQRQVFCSGRSCMAWNFLSNDTNATAIKACSCVHYAAALWAIASDASLHKDMGEYLDAFVAQAKKGNS